MEFTSVQKLQKTQKIQWKTAFFTFLLSVAPLGGRLLPFGVSFLCAVPKRERKVAFLGALLGTLFDKCIPLAVFCVCFAFFVLRAKDKVGTVSAKTKILLALSAGFLRASYLAVLGITSAKDVFLIIASVLSFPIFTCLFSGYFDKRKAIRPKRYDASLAALAFCLTLLFSGVKLFGVSIALLPAAFFTLCAARTKGFAFGGACGIICGLPCGGAVTGALGVLGMTYGLLVNELEPLALLLAFMLGISGFFYLSGVKGLLVFSLMLLLVFSVFVPLRNKLSIHKSLASVSEKRAHDRRISRYAAAFSSLSSLFYTVSEKTKEVSITDLNQGIVKCVENHCEHCSGCKLDKSEISNFFTSEVRKSGVAAFSRIPQHLTSVCPNACLMARDVNNLPELRRREGEKGLKQMADEYSAFSSILIDAAKKQEDSGRSDKELAEKIKKMLCANRINCDGVQILGTRLYEITVFGVKPDKITATPFEISKLIGSVVGVSLSEPEFVPHDDYILMRLHAIPSLRVEFAKVSEAKNGETVCGDTVSVFENDEKYFYCLVSDGMGSGRDAALTSRLSAIMLEKLLSVGAEKENALKLLNKALVEKQEEVFATVDLLEIDRIRKTATLIKAGAAPTVVIRNGKSVKLESRTPPAGIMKNVIADKKVFKIEKGDLIVMLSDGVLQTGNDFVLLPENGVPPMPSARALATTLVREARRSCETADDMSVCVLRIY